MLPFSLLSVFPLNKMLSFPLVSLANQFWTFSGSILHSVHAVKAFEVVTNIYF